MTGTYILVLVAAVFAAAFGFSCLLIWSIAQCHLLNENMAREKRKAQRKAERRRHDA